MEFKSKNLINAKKEANEFLNKYINSKEKDYIILLFKRPF